MPAAISAKARRDFIQTVLHTSHRWQMLIRPQSSSKQHQLFHCSDMKKHYGNEIKHNEARFGNRLHYKSNRLDFVLDIKSVCEQAAFPFTHIFIVLWLSNPELIGQVHTCSDGWRITESAIRSYIFNKNNYKQLNTEILRTGSFTQKHGLLCEFLRSHRRIFAAICHNMVTWMKSKHSEILLTGISNSGGVEQIHARAGQR